MTSREDLEEEHDEEDLDAVLKTQISSAMELMAQITQNPRFADFMKESLKTQRRKANSWAK